jgi:GAF domain-containing protein
VLTAAYNGWSSRSAALGVLNESHGELERFLTAGIDEQARARIGELPHGRGVLGVLIEHPQPLRLVDVSEHPSSYGFPAGHPPMRGFLGVPVVIHGQVWGNLYLTEKAEGEFTDRDEEAAVILAQWAAIAIENARLYALSEQRRELSEKASRGLRVSRDVAVAVGGEVALDRVLELIVERALALVDARSVLMWLRDREELILAARAGSAASDALGLRVPIAGTVAGEVFENQRSRRLVDMHSLRWPLAEQLGVADSRSALLVPMLHRGEAAGVLVVFDDEESFDEDAEHLLQTFAVSAATAVALAKSVQADRLRGALAAADCRAAPLGARASRRHAAGSGRPPGDALGSYAPRRVAAHATGGQAVRRPCRAGDRQPAGDHHRPAPRLARHHDQGVSTRARQRWPGIGYCSSAAGSNRRISVRTPLASVTRIAVGLAEPDSAILIVCGL